MRPMNVNAQKRTPLAKWMFVHKVTGRELSKKTGVSDAIISRLKNGDDVRVSEQTRQRIKEATGLRRL